MSYGLVDEEAGELVYHHRRVNGVVEAVGLCLPLDGERGISVAVVRDGRPLNVPDVLQDPRYVAAPKGQNRSELCVPMKVGDQVLGVLNAESDEPNHFTLADQQLLQTLADQAAVALENARLYTSVRSYADEQALLHQIGQALTSTLDFSTVVHAALSRVQRLFLADGVSLLQPDPQTDELCFVQARDKETSLEIPVRLSPGEGIAGWALKQRQVVVIEDAQSDPRWSDRVDQYLSGQTRAVMAVPLRTREHTVGVIEVISGEPGIYTRTELSTLQAIASTLAVALENASLYDEQKRLLREREHAQAQLIHNEKIAALGRLTASIAHEINNPLQSVQGCMTLVGEELEGDQRPEKLERYLAVAGSEIERISDIVRRMRDFYRPAREGMQPTDLHVVLESVLALTNKQLQHSDVLVERRLQRGDVELPHVQANPDHLKQVFLNLVLNAIDAMPEGGTLCVRTALDEAGFLCIEFSDTGEGMSPETQSRLFEPFFTTKEYGSGLGLSISYGIIEAHHGQITVMSEVGVGTTFVILLPLEQPQSSA
jgi:two-component system NtrC family sensor kinase